MSKTNKLGKISAGFHTVTPYLSVDGGVKAIEFYKKAFGAKELKKFRNQTRDGKIVHARLKIGDSLVMVSDRFSPKSINSQLRSPVTLHISSNNVDKLWKNALAAGAKVEMPLGNMFWGDRYGQIIDPFGHRWSMSTPIKMSKKEMEEGRIKAMAMFNKDKHPNKN
jgi:PhnB protein